VAETDESERSDQNNIQQLLSKIRYDQVFP